MDESGAELKTNCSNLAVPLHERANDVGLHAAVECEDFMFIALAIRHLLRHRDVCHQVPLVGIKESQVVSLCSISETNGLLPAEVQDCAR